MTESVVDYSEQPLAVEVDDVTMIFNMASESLTNLKEYFIKLAKHELFFEEFRALKHISFDIHRGEVVGLVGTNNLSTAIIIMGIAVILIFVASPGYLRFVLIGAGGAGFLAVFLSLESYRLERLAIWRHPEAYEKGYQTMQGLYAIGSGGLFGVGFGGSLQKLGFVPEAQNDMIFSIVCEEFGLMGAVLLMLLFVQFSHCLHPPQIL